MPGKTVLSMAAATEAFGYPKNAKIYHQRLGPFCCEVCRMCNDDVLEKYWSLTVLLDQIRMGTEIYQRKVDELSAATDCMRSPACVHP